MVVSLGGVALLAAVGWLLWPKAGTAGPWVGAWVGSPTSNVLFVRAVGQDGLAGQCGPPQVRLEVEETRSAVRVKARYARTIPGSGACADVGYGPTPHRIALKQSLGERVVIDAAMGEERELIVASTAATIRDLPPGFETYDVVRDTTDGADVIRRQWRGPGGFVVLTTQAAAPERLLHHRDVVHYAGTTVRFHVHEDEPRDVYDLEWRLPSGTQANVDLHLPHGTWTPGEALAVVERTTEATSRRPR